jgi:hypothetical protein
MTYRLRVFTEEQWSRVWSAKDGTSLWSRYIADCESTGMSAAGIYTRLDTFKATDVRGEPFLDFETEEDAIMFRLRFG